MIELRSQSDGGIVIYLWEEQAGHADHQKRIEVGENEYWVYHEKGAIVDDVKLADHITQGGILVDHLLVDADHQPGLQVGPQQTEEEGLDDEQHQRLLVLKGKNKSNQAQNCIPHACEHDGQQGVVAWGVAQLQYAFDDSHHS